ncbi:MAG: NAD(P)H-hydrate dehydratase, partial [Bacteroidota bacterium]
VLRAERTISLGLPKMALFAPANTLALGEWEVAPFRMEPSDLVDNYLTEPNALEAYLIEPKPLAKLIKKRNANDHKGSFGHALLLAGSFGKMGAAVIAGRAVLRAGAGLITCHVPRSGYEIMQISFPEAMCTVDAHRYRMTEVGDLAAYRTIGAGPGLGTEAMTAAALRDVLTRYDQPMVLDADVLNIISQEPNLLELVPKNSILTPHPKEFERLCGTTEDDFARWRVQVKFAKSQGVYLVLKTGYSAVATPTGLLYLNPTGNPGMGTAGAGDALTGILTGLLAQGYAPEAAATVGVYLHGLAGDLAAEDLGQEFLLAEDIVSYLGKGFQVLKG